MSNWVENSPARSIIVYTIFIAGTTWAAFTYVFDDNKVASYRAQLEQQKAKTETLEIEVSRLRDENNKYLSWLNETPKTIPYLEARIQNLSDDLNKSKGLTASDADTSHGTGTVGPMPLYVYSKSIAVGDAFLDSKTTAALGVSHIDADRTASITLTLPGSPTRNISTAKPGSIWDYQFQQKKYRLIINQVNWYNNTMVLSVNELPAD